MGIKSVHFWCTKCKKDFGLPSELRFVNSVIDKAWTAQCPECAKTLYRLRSEMAGVDPYFRLSKYMRSQVMKHQDNLVQAGDPRFNLLYPEHAKQQAEEENEKGKMREKKSYEDIQKKYG